MPLGTRKLELARQYPAGAGQNTFDPQKPRSKIARASRRPRSILESSSESPPAVLCREKPSPRVPSGTEPRPGWRRLARPKGSQLSYWPPNSRAPDSKNYSAQRSLPARQRNLSQTQNMRLNDFATLGAARGAARHSNRVVSTLTKARAVTRTRPPGRRAHRASYWPFGRKNSLRPRADGNRPNNSSLFGRFPTPALARGASYPDELELASGRPGPACSR